MKERGILFSAPMVRAILKGMKTQTRRIAKLNASGRVQLRGKQWHVDDPDAVRACPHGQPGDSLWVREAWAQPASLDPGPTFYRADYPECVPPQFENVPEVGDIRWRSPIHMFRRDSRITLAITSVRLERLHDISEFDAIAEGMPSRYALVPQAATDLWHPPFAISCYRDLWESLHGLHTWEANPWVWVIDFRRVD